MRDTADVTIIGGGPIGLFGLYCAGLYRLRARLIERLDRLGGQLEHLYPEKPIYDVGGFPMIRGRELVERLKQQAFQYPAEIVTGVTATALSQGDDAYLVETDQGTFSSRAVVITAGIGEFLPRRFGQPEIDQYEGRGLYYVVDHLSDFDGQRVLVVGGGDSAADWAMAIADRAAHVTMIHRRDTFQCHPDSLIKLQQHPRVRLLTNRAIHRVLGEDAVNAVELQTPDGRVLPEPLAVDRVIVAIGLIPGTDIFRQWGLDFEGHEIRVATDMSTNRPGVFAAGDIVTYPGKVKLIAAGFGEVATAVESARRYLEALLRTKIPR
ncbi:MAG: NAD(P)/FAD-dependent oxidoreductase [Firmicutes bacterium]|nr:NAD(P)/FAD-dependent oxidoreductase [Bacillota bacterium]